MKVTLDLDALRAAGELSDGEVAKLERLGRRSTTAVAFNILVGFGIAAVSAGIIALFLEPVTALAVGLGVMVLGFGLRRVAPADWRLLGEICAVIGGLTAAGGLLAQTGHQAGAFLVIGAVFAATALVVNSTVLAALAVAALAGAVKSGLDWGGVQGGVALPDMLVLILVFAGLGWVLYGAAPGLPKPLDRLTLAGAGAALIVVNLAFLVGSLDGDGMPGPGARSLGLPDAVYALVWALLLVGAGIWAAREGRRWVLNLVASFGAIHFFSQWFVRLEATPVSVLLGGVAALGFALVLWRTNQGLGRANP